MSTVERLRTVVNSARNDIRRRLQLRDVPKTALPTDIRRLLAKSGVENVSRVDIDYKRFIPTGSAWVTFTDQSFVRRAMQSLHGSIMAGHEVTAIQPQGDGDELPGRSRGLKGRQEAAQRGVLTGTGPSGGISGSGTYVVLYGLPGKMSAEAAGYYLKSFKLAVPSDNKSILKMESMSNMTITSKFLVHLASSAEAYRLVRKLHETFYEPEIFDKRYRVRARVIY